MERRGTPTLALYSDPNAVPTLSSDPNAVHTTGVTTLHSTHCTSHLR